MCIFSLACAAYTWYISEHNHRWFYLYINQDIPLPYQLYLKALWKHSCDILLQTDRQWCWLFLASFLDLGKACDECAFECSTNDRRASRGRNWSEYSQEVHSVLQEVQSASHDEEDLYCHVKRIDHSLSLNLCFLCSKCGPRLSAEAAEKLKNRYVLMRNGAGEYERETGKKITIPITVRYWFLFGKEEYYIWLKMEYFCPSYFLPI